MRIGITYDLKADLSGRPDLPDDFQEEFDSPATVEAIASRTPIVCSDHPMFRPVIVDRRNASVFAAGDYRSLATAIWRTLSDSDLYAQLSNNATLTWEALKGPADWRTMILKWAGEGPSSPWIQDRLLPAIEQRVGNTV